MTKTLTLHQPSWTWDYVYGPLLKQDPKLVEDLEFLLRIGLLKWRPVRVGAVPNISGLYLSDIEKLLPGRIDGGSQTSNEPHTIRHVFRWERDDDEPSGSLEPEKRNGTPKDIRPSEKELAETYTANYIEAERKAGRTPTQMGLEQSARSAGINRTHLRDAFHKLYEVRRGRRRKSAE
jgi:hypothetical protein